MNEWMKKNQDKVMYGLAILAVILLLVMFSSRSNMSGEIDRLSTANSALEADLETKGRALGIERGKIEEVTRDLDAAKSGAAKLTSDLEKLTADNAELSGRNKSLEASLAEAKDEIDRLDFVALLRKKNVENLRNQTAGLKRAETESAAVIAALRRGAEAADARISKLEEAIDNLSGPVSTESTLPAVPDATGTIVLNLSDTSPLSALASGLLRVATELSELGGGFDWIAGLTSDLEMVEELASAISEMSILITPSDDPAVYMSFFVDEETFDDFVSARAGSMYGFEEWDDAPDEGTGWTAADGTLYILKLSGVQNATVLISNIEQGIEDMASAARGKSPSFEAERTTAGDNYYQIKFEDGVKAGDIIENFSFDSNVRDLMEMLADDPERVLWSVAECSWTREDNTLSFDSYSDLFMLNPELASTKRTTEGTADIFGDGDLAYFVSADLGFILRCMLLGASDPVGSLFGLAEDDIGPLFGESDIRKIVDSGALSIVCVADGSEISTAYLLLESKAPDVADKIFSLSYMMGGQHTEIPGWENAMIWPVPVPDFPDIVLAKKGGALLIGLGSDESFGKKLTAPDEYKPYLSRGNAACAIVSPRLLDVLINLAELAVSQSGEDMGGYDEYIYGALTALRDSFDLICASVSFTGKSGGKIILKEGGDLLGAYLKLLSMSALQSLVSADAAADTAEAAEIVNDLRNLKSACLLFYADNDRWPSEDDLDDLDIYMAEPILDSGRYEDVILGPEYLDEYGTARINIGVTLDDDEVTEGVRGKLETRARSVGLLNGEDSMEPYEMDSMTVFINMR